MFLFLHSMHHACPDDILLSCWGGGGGGGGSSDKPGSIGEQTIASSQGFGSDQLTLTMNADIGWHFH